MELESMELEDTVSMMTSTDYKERFRAEFWQVKIRYDKLKAMCFNWDKGNLSFQPTCERYVYNVQLHIMEDYLQLLRHRANVEKIDLQEA